MKIAPFNPETLKEAIQILKNGGVIAHPTDTCYGLAADLMNPDAVKKVQDIKGREQDKPMNIMLPVIKKTELSDYAVLDAFSKFVSDKLLPGPVTILLPKGPLIPDHFFPGHKLIGIRIPYDDLTQDLLMAFGGPLVTTSANLSNEPPCTRHKEVYEIFKDAEQQPDLLFEGAVKKHFQPSTVILVKKDKIKITREGPMTCGQLEGILGVRVR